MQITPQSLRRDAQAAIAALESLQRCPMIYHAPQRVDSISWIRAEMLRLTVKEILKNLDKLERQRRAQHPGYGVRNLTPPQHLTPQEPTFIPASSFVVFGD